MKRIPNHILRLMADTLNDRQIDEMAIPSYLHPNPLLRWMAWHRVEVVADYLGQELSGQYDKGQISIMDYGCGTGVLLDECCRFAHRVYGIDPILNAAQILVKRWDLTQVRLLFPNQVAQGVKEASLDLIIAMEVLEHIHPLTPTLTQFREKLKRGGKLLVSLPTENILYRIGRRIAGFPGDYHHSNAASLNKDIEDFGFKPLHVRKIPVAGPLSIYWVITYGLGGDDHA